MAVDLHYFYGDCHTPEAQAQIKENFIQLLNTSILKEVCQDRSLRDKCKPENVNVTCGIVTRTKRRASGMIKLHLAPVHFGLTDKKLRFGSKL